MKSHLVTLNFKTRFSLPKVGNFHYSHEHEILVWRGEEYTDADSLAAAVNEALTYVESIGMEPRIIRVMSLDKPDAQSVEDPDAGNESQEQPQEDAPSSDLPEQSNHEPALVEPRKRGRPRKRLLTSATP